MSRFFKGSDSESESSSADEENVPRTTAAAAAVTVKNFQFSDDEEETKRVVRSAKDKRYDELREVIKQLKNHKKIKDMSNVLTDFDALVKAFEKAKKVVESEGGKAPPFYVRCLADLDDFINQCWEDREARKTMSKNNARSLTTLRQKLRKYNRDFEAEITLYKENPHDSEDEVERDDKGADDEEVSSDEDVVTGADFLQKERSKPMASDDESDDDDESGWTMSSSSSSSEDETFDPSNLAAMFLKKTDAPKKVKKEKREKTLKKEKKLEEEEDEKWEEVKGGVPMEKPKMFTKDQDITHESVNKKLEEIISARGKKSTDRSEKADLLKELYTISERMNLGPGLATKIMFGILAALFDYNPNIATCMKADQWGICLDYLQDIVNMVRKTPDLHVGDYVSDEAESFQSPPYQIRGCVLTIIERMDEEFTKMLQTCDPHSTEFVTRLKDEGTVSSLIEQCQEYLEAREHPVTTELCRIYLRRVEHTYYKFEFSAICPPEDKDQASTGEATEQMMDRLCKYIYDKDVTDRLRTRAMLCHIYHHALHDRWFAARDLMLMSNLQDNIQHSDILLQILYNRTMVQLGLCAFRQGMIKDAHSCLVDIQSGGRAKELLAQGLLMQKQHERTPEQEKLEKRRQMPYHMHINLELLECVYLVSAMLIEIPYMAAHELDARRRLISKNFHYVMRMADRQTLPGPPESMREHVVAASKAMKTGNWRLCNNFVLNEKMNTKVWDLFHQKDKVCDMIQSKIQEESLRTYLFTYSSVYDSISMTKLAEMFELEFSKVYSIISKMIINQELMASLDEPTQTVVMHRTEPSRLQSLALQLSDKVSNLVDNNEKLLEMKQGNFFAFAKPGNQRDYGGQQRDYGGQQNWNRRRGGGRDNRGEHGGRGRGGGRGGPRSERAY